MPLGQALQKEKLLCLGPTLGGGTTAQNITCPFWEDPCPCSVYQALEQVLAVKTGRVSTSIVLSSQQGQ